MSFFENLALTLNRRFLRSVVRDHGTMNFFLQTSANEEGNGEGMVFERVKKFVDGPIAKLVDTHAADEVRHEAMILAQLERRGGLGTTVIPDGFAVVERMAKEAGNIFDREFADAEDAAQAYFLLYAVERRAIERFTLMLEALEELGDLELADLYRRIAKDERVHMRYCVAATRAMVPDDAKWTAMRDRFVELEAKVFTEQTRALMFHQLDNVFTTMPWIEKVFWKSLRRFNDFTGRTMHVLDVGGAQELPSGKHSAPASALAA